MNSEHDKRIEEIRRKLVSLEESTESIARLLEEQTQLADGVKRMWISDIKDVFHVCVAAWELLQRADEGDRDNIDRAREHLYAAKNRLERASSELRSLNDLLALWVESDLRLAFEEWCDEMLEALEQLEGKQSVHAPEEPIIRVSDTEYKLLCSVCGKPAATFSTGISNDANQEKLNFSGIASSSSMDLDEQRKIFRWLQQKKLVKVHKHLKQFRVTEDGLDAYCPDCDKIYCREHYNVTEEYDEGFYDYARGTCPKGHTRIVDD
jgi:hypothetical protein